MPSASPLPRGPLKPASQLRPRMHELAAAPTAARRRQVLIAVRPPATGQGSASSAGSGKRSRASRPRRGLPLGSPSFQGLGSGNPPAPRFVMAHPGEQPRRRVRLCVRARGPCRLPRVPQAPQRPPRTGRSATSAAGRGWSPPPPWPCAQRRSVAPGPPRRPPWRRP
eukprot:2673591-Lingulodinium_polyedra.AAC.1